jgi:predicted alpha/beta superfamily hydrolase
MAIVAGLFAFALAVLTPPTVNAADAKSSASAKELAKSLVAGNFEFPIEVQVYDLPIAANGIAYRLYVRPPFMFPKKKSSVEVVYFLDAIKDMTGAAIMALDYELTSAVPSSYFVGIGYRENGNDRVDESDRTRDYTPTSFQPQSKKHFLALQPELWQGSGGAAAFLDVVETLIVPFIEAKFEVNAKQRTLVARSTGGLAALLALMTRPKLFNKYIIVSPALWWDDLERDRNERWAMKALLTLVQQRTETRVYFAVGAAEKNLGTLTDAYVFVEALQKKAGPNLRIFLDVIADATQAGVFPAAFMRGFLAVNSDFHPGLSPITWPTPPASKSVYPR